MRRPGSERRMKKISVGRILSQREIAPGIHDMWIGTELAREAGAGQFVGMYPRSAATLLPRPISVCETDREKGALRLVYREAGAGTREFAACRAGEEIRLLGILGNGFPLEQAEGRRVLLMGGGIGVPPILQLAKDLAGRTAGQVNILAGYRDGQLFLAEDLARYGHLYAATEDGSRGTRGNVMDALAAHSLEADVIYACGPMPMLRAVKGYAAGEGIRAYLSLEEHMACGVGACLGCVVKTRETDSHSHVHNARICTEGPVFDAQEVEI